MKFVSNGHTFENFDERAFLGRFRKGSQREQLGFPRGRETGGAALLIVLAFLVLLSGIVALFLARALVERDVSSSSMNQTRAGILAQSALNTIVGDLKQEIVLDSTPVTVGKVTVYEPVYPATSAIPSPMAPIRSTTPSANANLVRVSSRSDPAALTTLGLSTRASAVNSTSDVSANGRFVSLARWNDHYLNPRLNAGSAQIDSTPDTNYFSAPDWVMVTASGPQVLASWSNDYKNSASTNFITGRYAFAIYDEGGLIDANVAGYPTSTTSVQAGEKGSLALADLTQVITNTTQPGVDQLVGWRNYATAQPSGSISAGYTFNTTAASNYYYYVAPVTNSPPTFLSINPSPTTATRTDQTFTSRQALIRYQRATYQQPSAGYGISQDDLQYLGTFTRELNQPAFFPRATANSVISSAAAAGSTTAPISYATNNASSTNAPPEEVAVNLSSSSLNGQPLITQRFPLSRLALFENPSVNAAAIKTYFGLQLESGYTHRFTYSEPGETSMQIMTLAQVAASSAPRQPDFFEMLQAAVLSGSLYNYLGVTNNTFISGKSGSITMHMGADIIDQYQPNNYPIVIDFGTGVIAGTDDLPYFSEMLLWPYRPITTDPLRAQLDAYLLFELWNPHQQSTTTVPGPTKIRLVVIPPAPAITPDVVITTQSPAATSPNNQLPSLNTSVSQLPVTLDVSNPAHFREPTILSQTDYVSDPNNSANWQVLSNPATGSTESRLALAMNQGSAPDATWAKSQGLPYAGYSTYSGMEFVGNDDFIQLQALADDGNWYPYQGECTPTTGYANAYGTYPTCFYPNTSQGALWDQGSITASDYYTSFDFIAGRSLQLADPRCVLLPGAITGPDTPGLSIRSLTTSAGVAAVSTTAPTKPDYYVYPGKAGGSTAYIGMYAENSAANPFDSLSADNTYMYDGDGVLRPGDAYLGPTANPYPANQTPPVTRPMILHRPFRSVAEMGYAYRGMNAWKTINFFSPESADAGLLDFFSLEDAPMVAGKINLNTRQPLALKAVLSGAYRTESTSDYLTPADASSVANAIVAHNITAAGGSLPQLASKADLVRSLLADSNVTSAIDNITGTTSDITPDTIKTRREAVIRALADVGTARTWNLLIDVIAQSGRYAPNATQLSQFIVTGEKHYWLHVALDRYTGNIIDQQLEEVNE